MGDRLAAKGLSVNSATRRRRPGSGRAAPPAPASPRTAAETGASCAPVSCPSGVLSSSAVSVMNLPESIAPTIPRAAAIEPPARSAKRRFMAVRPEPANKKGGPKAALFDLYRDLLPDQFADLLAGFSAAALSPVAGAAGAVVVAAVDLMPCSRSAAVFSALSSLASGGT